MPNFGDYETVGEPVATRDERGHVSTIWQARRSGESGGRLYAIKCYAPRRRQPGEGSSGDALDEDLGLGYLEGIKQLKKAHSEGGRCLAPVHAFGIAAEGAWYVTDFYPRNTLKAWVARRGSVDSAAVRHVVYSVVIGCLALKRSRGYAHGNLKSGNVFLVGKPRPLRKTPLDLADPYPAAPLQLSRLEADDQHSPGELLHKVTEAQDLRAIGELILELVEGRLVQSGYDYNYPVASSPAWDRLGRGGERWRQLCNRLLDPQLSSAQVNLESLAKELQPSVVEANLTLILTVAGAVCVIGAAVYFGKPLVQYRLALSAAKEALNRGDFKRAIGQGEKALRIRPHDAKAEAFLREVGVHEEEYGKNVTAAQVALDRQDYANAITNASVALRYRQNDPEATEIKRKSEEAIQRLVDEQARVERRNELNRLMTAGGQAEQEKAWRRAADLFKQAVIKAEGLEAEVKNSAKNALEYSTRLSQAEEARKKGTVSEEINQLEAALKVRDTKDIRDLLEEAKKRARPPTVVTSEPVKPLVTPNVDQLMGEARGLLAKAGPLSYVGASNKLAEVLKVNSRDSRAAAGIDFVRWMLEGLRAKGTGNYTNALGAFRQAKLNIWTDEAATNGYAFCMAMKDGEAHLAAGKFQNASNEFRKAQATDGSDVNAASASSFVNLVLHGEQAYRNSSFKEANEQYKEAASKAERFSTYIADHLVMTQTRQKAEDLLNQGIYDAAVTNLEIVGALEEKLKIEPRDKKFTVANRSDFAKYAKEGKDELANGQFADAKSTYERALRLQPADKRIEDWLGLATGLDQGKEALVQGNYATAMLELSNAVTVALSFQEKTHITNATTRLDFAKELSQASDFVGKTNFDEAFKRVTNAISKAGPILLKEEIEPAKKLALSVATNACETGTERKDAVAATNWLARAEHFGAADGFVLAMKKKIENLRFEPSRRAKTNLFEIDFVWIDKTFQGKGAYVEVNELSWGQYTKLLTLTGEQAPSQNKPMSDLGYVTNGENLPAAFLTYQSAASFVEKLNRYCSSKGSKDRFRLATLEEYKALAGVNVGSDWVLDPATVVRLQKAGENLGRVRGGKPRLTTEGTKGMNGLCDVVGNVAEWSADGKPFGISFVRDPASALGRTLTRLAQGDPIGLRLVYEPSQ